MAHYPNPLAAIRASWLLVRARQGSENLPQRVLAEDVGVGQAAMSKYENGTREPSFDDLQRIVARTDYRLVVQLRREPRFGDRLLESMTVPDPTPYAVSDSHLHRRLPAQLVPSSGRLPSSEQDGPRLEEALLHLYEIQDLLHDARQPEARLQQTYEQWHHERDRDLIHLVLPIGAGAAQAGSVLARAIDHRTARPTGRRTAKTEQSEPRASRLTWAHIVCCLRAEEAICRDRAARLHHALDAARTRTRAQNRVADAELIARAGNGRPGALAELDQAKAALEQAAQRAASHGRNGGGEDVGRSGERYLAVELTQLADRAHALYEELAQEPAFAAWREAHAAVDPLYDAWLDGELRTAPAPPPLYPDAKTLHRRNFRLTQPAEGPAPYGTPLRTVYDHLGHPWQIVMTPETDAPKRAAVLAAQDLDQPTLGSTGPVYLLAEEADADRARTVIDAAPRTASLLGITAALRKA